MTWIASSSAEIGAARTLLDSWAKPGTIDELGFLSLLGAFSDRLYPATTTIMTRARYLVFLPAIFRHIERNGLARNKDADNVSRDWQDKLRLALVSNEDEGVIGRDAGRKVARPPSYVYWSALANLRIVKRRMSESAYLESLSSDSTSNGIRDDDKVSHDTDAVPFWDPTFKTPGIIAKEGVVTSKTSFDLTNEEAKALRERYDAIRPDGNQSLMSALFVWGEKTGIAPEAPSPWEVPEIDGELKRVVNHARDLSLCARGARLLYEAMLFKKRRLADPGTEAAFKEWWDAACARLEKWKIDDFSALPCVGAAGGLRDVPFIRSFRDRVVKGASAKVAYQSDEIRGIIFQRECEMREGRARLKTPFYLRAWNPPDSYDVNLMYELSYRHRMGTRFATEILSGLKVLHDA